jgi:hypothetical protein
MRALWKYCWMLLLGNAMDITATSRKWVPNLDADLLNTSSKQPLRFPKIQAVTCARYVLGSTTSL